MLCCLMVSLILHCWGASRWSAPACTAAWACSLPVAGLYVFLLSFIRVLSALLHLAGVLLHGSVAIPCHSVSSPHLEGVHRSSSTSSTFTHWGVPPPWCARSRTLSRSESKQTAFLTCLSPWGQKEISSLLWQVPVLGFSVLLPVAEYYR